MHAVGQRFDPASLHHLLEQAGALPQPGWNLNKRANVVLDRANVFVVS